MKVGDKYVQIVSCMPQNIKGYLKLIAKNRKLYLFENIDQKFNSEFSMHTIRNMFGNKQGQDQKNIVQAKLPAIENQKRQRPFYLESKWLSNDLYLFSLESEFYTNVELPEPQCNITGEKLMSIHHFGQLNILGDHQMDQVMVTEKKEAMLKIKFFEQRSIDLKNIMLIGGIY